MKDQAESLAMLVTLLDLVACSKAPHRAPSPAIPTLLYWARPVELLKVFEFGGGPGRERKVLSQFSFSFRYSFISSFVSGQSQSVLCPSQPFSFSSVFGSKGQRLLRT